MDCRDCGQGCYRGRGYQPLDDSMGRSYWVCLNPECERYTESQGWCDEDTDTGAPADGVRDE